MADPPAQVKKGGGSLMMFASFFLVLLVLFDPNLRAAMGNAVGFVLTPTISFGGRFPVWTLFFAGLLMVTGSTVLRHFLVDWAKLARAQEFMKVFQREMKSAKQENNTFKKSKLEAMYPKLMEMQAEVSTAQMKPMAFTMLLVIPIFAWMFAFTETPVAVDVDVQTADDLGVLRMERGRFAAEVLGSGGSRSFDAVAAIDVYAFPVGGGETSSAAAVSFRDELRGRDLGTLAVPAGTALPEARLWRVGSLAAGTFEVTAEGGLTVSEKKARTVLLLVRGNGSATLAAVRTGTPATLELDGPADVFATVPVTAAPSGGLLVVSVEGLPDTTLRAAQALVLGDDLPHAALTPHAVRTPWNERYDLLENWWFLPRWILLYSLFSIPFGQVLQKGLKDLEYRRSLRVREGAAA